MPVSPPLTVKESDDSVTVRPANVLSFNAADFTVAGSGDTATISIDSTGTGASLTDTYVGFGNVSNLMTGSANFTFTEDAGSGPVLLLTGENPRLTMQDDTVGGDAPYLTQLQQSGASLYFVAQDAAGTNNEMMRMANSYIALMRSMDANVGIGTVPQSNVALHVLGDDSTEPAMILESTSTDGDFAPELRLWRNSASPVAGDYAGGLTWFIEDDGGATSEISAIKGYVGATTAGAESADMYWYVRGAGTSWNMLALRGASRLVEVNVNNHDVDFIANGDSVADLFYVDASQDNVGIGGTPDSAVERLEISGTGTSTLVRLTSTDAGATNAPDLELFRDSPSPASGDYTGAISFSGYEDTAGTLKVDFAKIDTRMFGQDGAENGVLTLYTRQNNALRPQVSLKSGGFVYNENNEVAFDFQIETSGLVSAFFVDSGLDLVGVGTNPASGGAQFQVDEDASFLLPVNAFTANHDITAEQAHGWALQMKTGVGTGTFSLPLTGVIGMHVTCINFGSGMNVAVAGGSSHKINGGGSAGNSTTATVTAAGARYDLVYIAADTWNCTAPAVVTAS